MSSAIHDGILSRVTKDGVGYLVDQGSQKVFTFTFDKIANYRGESASELGLAAGVIVTYDLDKFGRVGEVKLKRFGRK